MICTRLPLFFFAIVYKILGVFELEADIHSLLDEPLQISVYTYFVDGTHCGGRHFERHPLISFRYVESLFLEVGQKAPLGLLMGVRYMVSRHGALTCQLTYFRHRCAI